MKGNIRWNQIASCFIMNNACWRLLSKDFDQFRKIIICYKRIGYNINIMRQSAQSRLITLLPSLIARRWVGHQTQWWPRHKAIYFSWLRPWLFCPLLRPPGFNCWFSFAPVFQWCCSTPQGSPGVGHNTLFLSSPHLFVIIVFICDLFLSRGDPWWVRELENLHADRVKPPTPRPFQGGTSVVVPHYYLFLLSVFILWSTYDVSDIF